MQLNAGLFALALAGFSALAAAQPHKHQIHARHHLKHRELITSVITITVDQYGNTYGTVPTPVADTVKVADVKPTGAADKTSTSFQVVTKTSSSSSATVVTKTSSSVTPVSTTDLADPSKDKSTPYTGGGGGIGADFPDGEVPCTHFPSEYGAEALSWVTKGGWSGIQVNGGSGDAAGICVEGALCSYACPAGYSKAQWPSDQPASGESHGGLLCKGGKLYKTRTDYNKLCQAGHGSDKVKNTLGKFVAICRTDYPGKDLSLPLISV